MAKINLDSDEVLAKVRVGYVFSWCVCVCVYVCSVYGYYILDVCVSSVLISFAITRTLVHSACIVRSRTTGCIR